MSKKENEFESAERRKMAREYWDGVLSEYASLRQEAERDNQGIITFEKFCFQQGYRKPEV